MDAAACAEACQVVASAPASGQYVLTSDAKQRLLPGPTGMAYLGQEVGPDVK